MSLSREALTGWLRTGQLCLGLTWVAFIVRLLIPVPLRITDYAAIGAALGITPVMFVIYLALGPRHTQQEAAARVRHRLIVVTALALCEGAVVLMHYTSNFAWGWIGIVVLFCLALQIKELVALVRDLRGGISKG